MRAAKNISKRMTWVIASLVLVISQITPVILTTQSAKAAAYELGSSSGTWTSTSGGSGITGLNSSEVRWGTPANDENKKSGLKFSGSTNQTFNEGEKFLLGDLTHYNWPVEGGTAANGATLKIVLDFDSPVITPNPDFSYNFVIDETTNSAPCAGWQISSTPCDDKITFPNSYGSKSFTIGDKLYTLKIEGFTNCGAGNTPVSQFITEEKKDSKACLYGSLSSVLVNSPQLTLVEKAVNGYDADVAPGPTLSVGDTASFTYKVQNTGNVTMTNITVTDDKGVAVTCPKTTLTAGELMTCTGSAPVVNGAYKNTAYASGKYDGTTYKSNNEVANYTGAPKPGNLTVTKVVINNDGGAAVVADFPLFVNGTPVVSGQSYSYAPGTYTVTETQKNDYAFTGVSGNCTKNYQNEIKITVVTNQNVTCTLTNNDKAPELTLKKKVTNNNGGTATASNWTVTATPATNSVGAVVISGNGSNGVNNRDAKANVAYTLSESGPSGYAFVKWTCDGGTLVGNVLTLPLNKDVECTVENDDIGPGLTLVKKLIKDNGGAASATDWTLKAVGTVSSPTNLSGVTGSTGATSGPTFKADTYTLSETGGPTGYTKSAWDCTNGVSANANNQITLVNGKTTVCTITNNDDTPALTLIKKLGETYGSNVKTTDWTLTATGALDPSTDLSGATGTAGATSGPTFKADTYTLGESGPTGFTASWNCVGGTLAQQAVAIALGQTVTCTVTNTAIQPKLTVTKVVENGTTGSTKTVADFPLNVSGTPVTSGVTKGFNVGNYVVGEVTDPGYSVAITGDCKTNGEVSLALADVKSCTITNTAIAPKLTVKKHVVNDNGGGKAAGDFTMNVTGTNVSSPSFAGSESGTTVTLNAGDYSVDETSVDGYTKSLGANCSGTIKLGEEKTCIITNSDDPAALTLIKKLGNLYGATGVSESDWTLSADGPDANDFEGEGTATGTNLSAGSYTLKETSTKWTKGFTASDWSCLKKGAELPTIVKSSLVLALGNDYTCTITNSGVQPKLTVTKVVNNTNGGDKEVSDFPLNVSGTSVTSGDTNGFDVGNYTVGEVSDSNYTATFSGDCDKEGKVSLALGDEKQCTITNTSKGGTIIINKVVINDDDGESTAGDFSVKVNDGESMTFEEDSEDPLLGQVVVHVPVGYYTVLEDGEGDNGYFTVYENDCDPFGWELTKTDAPRTNDSNDDYEDCYPGDCEEMYVGLGETITCTITNDDEGEGTGRSVDLSVNKDDKGVIAQADGSFVYGIFVQNNGNAPASNVVMEDVIPANLKVNSISAGDWTCAVTGADSHGYGGTLTCTLPSLAGGEYADSIILNVTVGTDASGVIENTACVDSTQRDYYTDNNCDTEYTPIESIKVVKTGVSSASAGDNVTYTFTVTNTGETPLSDITVTDDIAGNAVYQSGDVNNNGVLEQDETWIFTAQYTIPANAGDQVVNTATACGTTFFFEEEEQPELSDNIKLLRINSIAVDTPDPVTPVCNDDSHTLTVNEELADTGNQVVLTSVMAFAMIVAALYMALPQKRDLSSRK